MLFENKGFGDTSMLRSALREYFVILRRYPRRRPMHAGGKLEEADGSPFFAWPGLSNKGVSTVGSESFPRLEGG